MTLIRSHAQNNRGLCARNSAIEGGSPPHATRLVSILVHRFSKQQLQSEIMEEGTSRANAWASCHTKSAASSLHLHESTTSRQRPTPQALGTSLPCLVLRGPTRSRPHRRLVGAVVRLADTAQGDVDSKLDSVTFTFVSRRYALNLTRAPAFCKFSPASFRWVWPACVSSVRVHAALWRPQGSRGSRQPSHTALVMGNGRANRSNNITGTSAGES